jgi:hypothetical protein
MDISAIEVVLSRLNAKCEVSDSLIEEARMQFSTLTSLLQNGFKFPAGQRKLLELSVKYCDQRKPALAKENIQAVLDAQRGS